MSDLDFNEFHICISTFSIYNVAKCGLRGKSQHVWIIIDCGALHCLWNNNTWRLILCAWHESRWRISNNEVNRFPKEVIIVCIVYGYSTNSFYALRYFGEETFDMERNTDTVDSIIEIISHPEYTPDVSISNCCVIYLN